MSVKIGLELSQRHFWKAEVIKKAPWKSQGGGVIGSILKKIPNIFHLQEKYFQFFNFSSSTFQLQAFVSPERLEILCPSKKQICLLDQLEIMRNSTFSRSEPWFMNGNNKRTVNVPKNRYFLLLGMRTFIQEAYSHNKDISGNLRSLADYPENFRGLGPSEVF